MVVTSEFRLLAEDVSREERFQTGREIMMAANLTLAARFIDEDDFKFIQTWMMTFLMRLSAKNDEASPFYYSCRGARYLVTPQTMCVGSLPRVNPVAYQLEMARTTVPMFCVKLGMELFNKLIFEPNNILCHGQTTSPCDPEWKCHLFEQELFGVPAQLCCGTDQSVYLIGKYKPTHVLDGGMPQLLRAKTDMLGS